MKQSSFLRRYKPHEWFLLCLAFVIALGFWWLYSAWLWGSIKHIVNSNAVMGLGLLGLFWAVQSTLVGFAAYHLWRQTWDFSQFMLALFAGSFTVFFIFTVGCVIVPWYGLPT